MKLKLVCCFKELSYGDENADSIKKYISNNEYKNKNRIIEYLDSGICIASCVGVSEDVINPQKGIIGAPDALTDGKFQWYADLSYYVKEYNLKLPQEFIDNMIKNNWKIPISDKDIEEEIEYI